MKPYLRSFRIQRSAGEGPSTVRQDRKLGDAIKTAAEDGVIDKAEMDQDIAPLFADRGAVAKSEAGLVGLLDSARDGRRRAEIDGVRVKMTPGAEKAFLQHRAALDAKLEPAPVGLGEAAYRQAAVGSAKDWYRRAVATAWADVRADEEAEFDPAAEGRDLALADRITFGGGDGALYSLRAPVAEDVDFYRNRTFFTAGGDRVPAEQVRLHRLDHEPEYAGQVLTSLLAIDRRDGALLGHLWTVD